MSEKLSSSVTFKQKRERNAEKALIKREIIYVSPLVPAVTAEKVGPNEASILLCSGERMVERTEKWVNRQYDDKLQDYLNKRNNYSNNALHKTSII